MMLWAVCLYIHAPSATQSVTAFVCLCTSTCAALCSLYRDSVPLMQLSLYMFMHSCSGVVAANVHCEGGEYCLFLELSQVVVILMYIQSVYV